MREQWHALWTIVRTRLELLRRTPEAGYSTETVLVTALLVVAALAVLAVIASKVLARAQGIDL